MELMILIVIILVRPWDYQLFFNCTQDCECKYTIQIQRPVHLQDSFMGPLRFQMKKGEKLVKTIFANFIFL